MRQQEQQDNASLFCHMASGDSSHYFIESDYIYDCGGDFIGLSYYHLLLLLLLFLAALSDLRTDRIPNGLVILGMAVGLSGKLWFDTQLWQSLVSMLLAFLLMYPLFKIGALGAGDVKVLMMIGSFLKIKGFITVLAASFVIGALFSLLKLLAEHNGRERIYYFLSYVAEVAGKRQWKIYGEHLTEDYQQYCRNKIHFTVPVLFGVVLWTGGII